MTGEAAPPAIGPDALRAAALALLDAPHGGGDLDPRARDMLARGELAVVHDVVRWDASPGAVRAHRVLLGVGVADLALLERAPGVRDELARALSAALAAHGRAESLADLRVYWALADAPGARAMGPYRAAPAARAAAPDDPAAVRAALAALLAALGEDALAALVTRAELALRRDRADAARLTLTLPREAPARDPHRRAALERAAGLLLAGPDERAVHVALRGR